MPLPSILVRRSAALVLLTLALLPSGAVRLTADEAAREVLRKRVGQRCELALEDGKRRLKEAALLVLEDELRSSEPASWGTPDDAAKSITPSECFDHDSILASTPFGGRESGTPEGEKAAKFIADRFREYGLRPLGADGSYLQEFGIGGSLLGKKVGISVHPADGEAKAFQFEKLDFSVFDFSGAGQVTAPVVFVGYGITAPEFKYDDYEGVDVKGKIVLCLRHEPQEDDKDSAFLGSMHTKHASFVAKAKNAEAHGAAALLLVTDPNNHKSTVPFSQSSLFPRDVPPELQATFEKLSSEQLAGTGLNVKDMKDLLASLGEGSGQGVNIPCAHVSVPLAEACVAGLGKTLAALQTAIDGGAKPASAEVPGATVTVEIEVMKNPQKTWNVIGCVDGSDPVLKDEYVVVGAHYDHIGLGHFGALDPGNAGKIHYGADDNASGTSGVLEVAEALGRSAVKPKRSILLMAFAAEEKGLLGSLHYCRQPLVPLAKTVAMLNMDMIGRNETNRVEVDGASTSKALQKILEEENAAHEPMTIAYGAGVFFRQSDQYSFYEKDIPCLYFGDGLHPDYHRHSDTFDKIDAVKIARISRLCLRVAWRVTDMEGRPDFSKITGAAAANRPRLGVVSQPLDAETLGKLGLPEGTKGVMLAQVVSDLPGAKAGLLEGDVITACDGKKIEGKDPVAVFRDAIVNAKKGVALKIELIRAKKPMTIEVTFPE